MIRSRRVEITPSQFFLMYFLHGIGRATAHLMVACDPRTEATLTRRGWLFRDGKKLGLTPEGRKAYEEYMQRSAEYLNRRKGHGKSNHD